MELNAAPKPGGEIRVVGIGPGGRDGLTLGAWDAIATADIIVGYKTYTDQLRPWFPDMDYRESGMTQEVDRCIQVLELARLGQTVALVSGGDSGIYGMAGIMLEVAQTAGDGIAVRVISGVTALSEAAACLGAPIMHDFAVVSLSDLMTPLDLILRRVEAAAKADFVLCLYNPKSHQRQEHIRQAHALVCQHRADHTPVGIVWNAGRPAARQELHTLATMLAADIDMSSIVIIGNSQTFVHDGKMITPRGYSR